MSMQSQNTISAYLLPSPRFIRRRRWLILQAQLDGIVGRRGGVFRRGAAALAVWVLLAGAVGYATTPHSLSSQKDFAGGAGFGAPESTLGSASPVASLTGGPSGQLLPPGTMAADGTFSNHYAHGQCTWYVAGRRQVPPGWGNAASWYYHAIASGWRVGTVPAIAAIAWTPAGYFGHVALVEQISSDGKSVYISEMNYRAVGVKTYRWVPSNGFKYIY